MASIELIGAIEKRIMTAQNRYGDFSSTHEALGVALEEWDELLDAIRSNNMNNIEHECLDLAAVLIRLATNLHNGEKTKLRSIK